VFPLTIRLALADDQRLFREGLRALLRTQPNLSVVVEMGGPEELPHGVERSGPVVVLVDYQLKGMPAPYIIRQLLRRNANGRILVLSMHTVEDRIAARVRYRRPRGGYRRSSHLLRSWTPSGRLLAARPIARLRYLISRSTDTAAWLEREPRFVAPGLSDRA